MRCRIFLVLFLLFATALAGCTHTDRNAETLFQTSTIEALLKGEYEGETSIGELKRHGDFGLGAFNGLDGEMVVLDGVVFHIGVDGTATPAPDDMKTPFAVVTFFTPDQTFHAAQASNLDTLKEILTALMPSANRFYAIRVDGRFTYLKTRSVPRQSPPYPPLAETLRHQQVTEFHDTEGTLVGFYCPPFAEGFNVPGYHFHFITGDRKRGGHVLEVVTGNVRGTLQELYRFSMILSRSGNRTDLDPMPNGDDSLKSVTTGNGALR